MNRVEKRHCPFPIAACRRPARNGGRSSHAGGRRVGAVARCRTNALVRTPLKELLAQLDPERFVQVHRAVVVNLRAIDHVVRHDNETAEIRLKGRDEVLPVSRAYLHVFRQM